MKSSESVSVRIMILSLFLVITLNTCGQSKKVNQESMNMNTISKPNNPYYSHTDTTRLNLPDAEWKKILPEDVYEVSRHAATEGAVYGKVLECGYKGYILLCCMWQDTLPLGSQIRQHMRLAKLF